MEQCPLRVFISYSHTDEEWLNRVKQHLIPVVRESGLDCWDDTHIRPGDDWKHEIQNALDTAQAAVLLISASFFASDFINENELPPLLTAAQAKGVRILPVILSASRFGRHPDLARFQAINSPDRPLSEMPRAEQEKVLDRLAQMIEKLIPNRQWPAHEPPPHSEVPLVAPMVTAARTEAVAAINQKRQGDHSQNDNGLKKRQRERGRSKKAPNQWSASDWNLLLEMIRKKNVTVFVGPGTRRDLGLGARDLARLMVDKFRKSHHISAYPYNDKDDLAHVTQYISAFDKDRELLRTAVRDILNDKIMTALNKGYEQNTSNIYSTLAGLELKQYVTTNYDDLLHRALIRHRGESKVQRVICNWRDFLKPASSGAMAARDIMYDVADTFRPTKDIDKSIVFYFNGHISEPEGIVLTQSDYIDFSFAFAQARLSQGAPGGAKNLVLPPVLECAFKADRHLFIGYNLTHESFHLLHSTIRWLRMQNPSRSDYAVQYVHLDPRYRAQKVDYAERFFDHDNFKLHFSDISEFATELRNKWDRLKDEAVAP